jgi:hypothetical protein
MNPNTQNTQEDAILQAIPELSLIKDISQRRKFAADIARILENLKRKRF